MKRKKTSISLFLRGVVIIGIITIITLQTGWCTSDDPIDSVDCDVLVVGAGSAGVPAAVQSARAGVKTILIENGFQPGGTTTSGGVNFPGLFHAWGKQIIAGIGWEWIMETVKLNGAALPDFSIPTGRWHWKHQIHVNAATYAVVGEDLCIKAGVDLRYYEAPMKVQKIGDDTDLAKKHNGAHWRVITVSQGEIREIFCKEMIDCTGNGQLCKLAGAERMREPETQPGTFSYRLSSGMDLAKADKKLIEQRFREAIQTGELKISDARNGILDYLKGNTENYVYGADNSTGILRTKTNLEGRQSMLRMLHFIRRLPGGEKARIVDMSPEVGVRETYRIRGEYVITLDDYTSGRIWDDSLACSFYPIDLHRNKTGVQPAHLQEGKVASIPLRALIPAKIDHLLIAGRCISSDRMANSALRVQATCMSSGQAAGALAVIAVLNGMKPAEVDVKKVKDLLQKHGAIVPEPAK